VRRIGGECSVYQLTKVRLEDSAQLAVFRLAGDGDQSGWLKVKSAGVRLEGDRSRKPIAPRGARVS